MAIVYSNSVIIVAVRSKYHGMPMTHYGIRSPTLPLEAVGAFVVSMPSATDKNFTSNGNQRYLMNRVCRFGYLIVDSVKMWRRRRQCRRKGHPRNMYEPPNRTAKWKTFPVLPAHGWCCWCATVVPPGSVLIGSDGDTTVTPNLEKWE